MSIQTTQQQIRQAMGLLKAGNLGPAEIIARQVLSQSKKDGDGLAMMGLIAYERGDCEEAASWHQKSVTAHRKQPLYHCNLAIALAGQGKYSPALSAYEKALKLNGDLPEALAGKADVLERKGKPDRAQTILEPAAKSGKLTPKMAAIYARILQRRGRDEEVIAFAEAQLVREDVQNIERRLLLLTLGKVYDRLDDRDRAFEAYSRGNEIGAMPFDIGEVEKRFDALQEAFSREAMSGLPRATHGSELPVFIAGMARSGTTLVEQIIHAHPKAHGAGEIGDLGRLIHDLPTKIGSAQMFPQCVTDLTIEDLDRLAGEYLDSVKRLNRGAVRIADKTLDTFQHIGIASLLFPGARVIHIRRHPMDTCFSCFFENLPPLRHPYSSDLTDLGLYYRQYKRLMDFWRENVDIALLEVDYEALVEDQEAQTRRIIEFMGLDWDDRCLRFHEAKREVTTLSYDQVRRPIYKSAIARYKRYLDHLGPLSEALGDLAEG